MPTIPIKKATKGARPHRQTYHVSAPPEAQPVVVLTATNSKSDSLIPSREAAPAAATSTTSETGLVTISNAEGSFTYLNNLPHSENDQPSHRRADGSLAWYRHGEPHRFGGPSSTDPDGSESWHAFGERHRDGGPAVTHRNGDVEFHVLGVRYENGRAADKATTVQIESHQIAHAIDQSKMPAPIAAFIAARGSSYINDWAKSDSIDVRTGAAQELSATAGTLDLLLRDRNPNVRGAAAFNLLRRERLRVADAAGA